MTDDLTQRHETTPAGDTLDPMTETTSTPALAAEGAGAAEEASSAPAPVATVAPAGSSRGRWLIALGVAGVAIVAGLAALLLFGKPSTPEALAYIPGDAAFVIELRPELPGDQMQALGNLLAHFPGFQDQSTLSQKIDEALKRLIAQNPGSSVDYEKDVKPFISGPIFVSVQSFEDMATSDQPTNFAMVFTTTGTVTCDGKFGGTTFKPETYNGLTLNVSEDSKQACVIDGRFALAGDPAGVKAAIDARKGSTGIDRSARYTAARTQLGLDRLVTMYLDGASLAKALPSSDPTGQLADLAGALPEWMMAGVRAENDALQVDVIAAAPQNPAAVASLRPLPAAHPLGLTAFAPADTLVFIEAQGFGISIRNVVEQLKAEPTFSDALKQLDTFGGIDGLIDWIDDAGVLVFKDGESAAGGLVLVAKDAAAASEKVTALETVIALAGVGGQLEVSTTTIEGTKVTTVHIPDAGALAGGVTGGAAVPLDLSLAAKDKYVLLGIGQNAMAKLLAPKAGSGLADNAAFKRALTRALPNPQVLIYVAAGATIDLIESATGSLGGPALPADMKAYLDPIEGFIYTTVGDGLHGGSLRFALTVANP